MKIKVPVPTEIEVSRVLIHLPVDYDEEDIPNNFPLRAGDVWEAKVDIDNGRIENWPADPQWRECFLNMKVRDGGTYTLLGPDGKVIACLKEEYVPHGLIPGEYGDYVKLKINDGVITNWPKKPRLDKFFVFWRDDED